MLTIKTNNQWRDFVYRDDVPAAVLADQFSHLSEDDGSDGFFCYRGHWYHTTDFMNCSGNKDLVAWDGYASDSYFSGVLIKISRDGDAVQVATYFS